jgi:hypothetical protein
MMKEKWTKADRERFRREAENDPWVVNLRALVAEGEAELKARRKAAEGR